MEAAREALRRVVPLVAVTKITQLSPEALTMAANRALAAVFKLAPPTELGGLDGEVHKLAKAILHLEAMIGRLVMGRGPMAGAMPASAALTTVRAASYAAQHCSLQVQLQLFDAGAVMLLYAAHGVLQGLSPASKSAGYLISRHLEAAQALLEVMVSGPPDAERELCAAATKAFRVTPTVTWLMYLTAQLAVRPIDFAVWSDLSRYTFVCKQLFHGEPVPEGVDFSAVQAEVSPEGSAAIARLLLRHTLHAAMAAVTSSVRAAEAAAGANGSRPSGGTVSQEEQDLKVVGWIGSLVKAPSLRPALLQVAGADASGVQSAAAQLVAQLPAACPQTVDPCVFHSAWQGALDVLLLPSAAIQEQQQLSSTQRASSERSAAVAAAECLPHLAAAVRAAPECHAGADNVMAGMCSMAVELVRQILTAVRAGGAKWEAQQCATLLRAADAMLRTVPVLHRAQQAGQRLADNQQQPASEQPASEQQQQQQETDQSDVGQDAQAQPAATAAVLLRTESLQLFGKAAALASSLVRPEPQQLEEGAEAADGAKALVRSAWRLHTTACRWVHWAAAAGDAQDLAARHATLHDLGLVWDSWPTPVMDDRTKRGARAAHLAAMEAIAAAQGPVQQWETSRVQGWAVHLAWLAAEHRPEVWPSQLGEMLLEATSALIQSAACVAVSASRESAQAQRAVSAWLMQVACSPSAVFALLPSGLFAQALAASEAVGCLAQVVEAFDTLLDRTATQLPTGSHERQSMDKLLAWLQPLLATADSLSPSQIAGFKQWLHSECLPALAVAAAAMQRHLEQRPWIRQAEVLLESGLAAATRSCAYLRCANLGGEGGPAAGEGHGSAMCCICREAWYCSTACSEADWRQGGHRRLCKAMAAWHQQQKEQRVERQLERP